MEVAQCRGSLHLGRNMAMLEAVDLVERDDHGEPEAKHPAGDEAISRPDAISGGHDEQHEVDLVERGVNRLLHALRESVHRPLKTREIGQDELPVRAIRDPEDAPTRRVRHVRRNRHLVAAQRVDECGFADVRPPGDGNEARSHASSLASNCSGRSSATVILTSRPPFRKTTRSTSISANHWRQPPHGECVIAATVKSPGR